MILRINSERPWDRKIWSWVPKAKMTVLAKARNKLLLCAIWFIFHFITVCWRNVRVGCVSHSSKASTHTHAMKTAGQFSSFQLPHSWVQLTTLYVPGRSCDRPSWHRFSWVHSTFQANVHVAAKFQVVTACLSCSPPNLNSSKFDSLLWRPINQISELSICQLFKIPWPSFLWFTRQFSLFNFLGWGETESTWYPGHWWAHCTSPGW
jgi:hypothetical protein